MKKPASAGANGLSKIVASRADNQGYAPTPGALQARALARRYHLTPAAAAAIAALAFPVIDDWRMRA